MRVRRVLIATVASPHPCTKDSKPPVSVTEVFFIGNAVNFTPSHSPNFALVRFVPTHDPSNTTKRNSGKDLVDFGDTRSVVFHDQSLILCTVKVEGIRDQDDVPERGRYKPKGRKKER